MKLLQYINSWFQSRRDHRAQALSEDYTDIVDLHRKGLVLARGTGQSITDIRAEIRSRVSIPLKVLVPHGTYFVSRGNHQNMVSRRQHQFVLAAHDTEHIHVPASCINASLPIPRERDRFSGVARVSPVLRRFMEAAEGEDAMVIQAGVWAITDGYTRQRIQSTLRVQRTSTLQAGGKDSGPAISAAQIDLAGKILRRLGIRTNL